MSDFSGVLARIAARACEDDPLLPLAGLPAPLTAVANGGFGPDCQLLPAPVGPGRKVSYRS